MKTLQEISLYFKETTLGRNGGYTALCPAHEDHNPSLSITEKGDRILLNCFADCKVEDILNAVGLTWSDINPELELKPITKSSNDKSYTIGEINKLPNVINTYIYHDEQGIPLHLVVRKEAKKFLQYRYEGGKWKKGLNGIQTVIYRLPEVIKAVKENKIIYIAEGEKDANNLVTLELVATCNPMGAGKWREHYNQYFNGAKVVILPDNDTAGREHGEQVANYLYRIANEIKVLNLPNLKEKEDVSDWIKAGGTKEQLEQLVNNTQIWLPAKKQANNEIKLLSVYSIGELLQKEYKPINWIVEDLIPEDSFVIIGGKKKSCKSWMCSQLALAVATGSPFLGRETKKGKVLYLSLEDGERRTIDRFKKQGASSELGQQICLRWDIPKIDELGITAIKRLIEAHTPNLVIIDTLRASLSRKVDENSSEMGEILNGLHSLTQEMGCSIIIIHHHGKRTSGNAGDDFRGSSAIAGATDVNIGIYRIEGYRFKIGAEGKDIPETEFYAKWDAGYTWCWQVEIDQKEQKIISLLQEKGQLDIETISDYTKIPYSTLDKMLRKMFEKQQISRIQTKTPDGRGNKLLYELPDLNYNRGLKEDFEHLSFL